MVVVYEEGFFDDLIILFLGLECDNNLCVDFIVEKFVKFKLVFGKGDVCIMIVGNLILFMDGVFCVFLVFEEWVKVNGYVVFVYLIF